MVCHKSIVWQLPHKKVAYIRKTPQLALMFLPHGQSVTACLLACMSEICSYSLGPLSATILGVKQSISHAQSFHRKLVLYCSKKQ